MKEKIINKKDPFGFDKAINWDKLNDPKVLNELEKLLEEEAPSAKLQAPRSRHN
jgi:hypothetical protein